MCAHFTANTHSKQQRAYCCYNVNFGRRVTFYTTMVSWLHDPLICTCYWWANVSKTDFHPYLWQFLWHSLNFDLMMVQEWCHSRKFFLPEVSKSKQHTVRSTKVWEEGGPGSNASSISSLPFLFYTSCVVLLNMSPESVHNRFRSLKFMLLISYLNKKYKLQARKDSLSSLFFAVRVAI